MSVDRSSLPSTRFVLFHKDGNSARTRFLCFAERSVCTPSPLPSRSRLIERRPPGEDGAVVDHPAALLGGVQDDLGVAPRCLEVVRDFVLWVDTPEGECSVRLARFTTSDPPFEVARRHGATFITMTEARPLALIELEVLRHAYHRIMG